MERKHRDGFTLIELSIVLVIIGLIVGGVLVGRDLISAAQIRATIGQVGKFDTAVMAFRAKYNCLPGDCALAGSLGFKARGTLPGEGDGNGVIEGIWSDSGNMSEPLAMGGGECIAFWGDLGAAGLVPGAFNLGDPTTFAQGVTATSSPALKDYFPTAKIGDNYYFYVYSQNHLNYYGLSGIHDMESNGEPNTTPTLTVGQAYNIDQKIDDGLPQTGRVTTVYDSFLSLFEANNYTENGASIAPSSTTCYDNNSSSVPLHYSMEVNGGEGMNCALSLQFR